MSKVLRYEKRAAWLLCACLCAQDLSEQQRNIEHARSVNLERAATLPSFVADEIVLRYTSPHVDPPQWKLLDTIESEIAVHGTDFIRRNTRIDGRPWNKPDFPRISFSVDFGAELKPLFESKCQTMIVYEGTTEALGRPALAYRFRAPGMKDCFGTFGWNRGFLRGKKVANPPWSGRFLVEDPGGSVIRFEEEAHEFPKDFPADPFRESVQWDYVKIGEGMYLLPVSEEFSGGFPAPASLYHVTVQYKNHRHFEAASSVTFH